MSGLYEHTQRGRFAIPVVILSILVTAGVLVSVGITAGWAVFTLAMVVLVLILMLMFDSLKVTVNDESLEAAFRFGWPRRTVEFDQVAAVRQVRNPWWYGWGLRWIPGGRMYNVWGLDAVEFEFRAGGVFRVGTDEPKALLAAVEDLV